jgi:hypothetical protein
MSSNTWTLIDLASESGSGPVIGWRMVEAQHEVATMQLAGSDIAAQAVLENIVEEFKPALPPETDGLHWLLATPFRYYPLPGGSRFRKRDEPGVFYGAEERQTACAEAGYWRLRFWMDSEALSASAKAIPVTLFPFASYANQLVDLTRLPFAAHRDNWMDRGDYGQTQALAGKARDAGVEVIRYESVRRPGGYCFAILSPEVFRRVPEGIDLTRQQAWTLHINPPGKIVFRRDLSDESFSFAWS